MKKMLLTSSLLVPSLLLGACTSTEGDQSNPTQNENQSNQQNENDQSQNTDQSGNPQDENNQQSETDNSNSQNSENASENNSEEGYTSIDALINDVEANLKTDVPFVAPTDILKDENTYYSAAINNISAGYSVIIFQTNEPMQINDAALNKLGEESQLVTLTGTKYETAQSAQGEVSYQEIQQGNTDLGYGIKGMQEGAAGSKYVSWNEGRWFLNIVAHTNNSVDMTADAKRMVEFLEANTLPVPNNYGKITVDYRENKGYNSAIWQNGQDLYEVVPNTSDPVEALKMITSVEK